MEKIGSWSVGVVSAEIEVKGLSPATAQQAPSTYQWKASTTMLEGEPSLRFVMQVVALSHWAMETNNWTATWWKKMTLLFFSFSCVLLPNPLVLAPSSANCFQKREPRSLHMFWLGMPNLNCCRSQKCTRGLRTWCGVFSWGSFCSGCMCMLNAPVDRQSLFLRFS